MLNKNIFVILNGLELKGLEILELEIRAKYNMRTNLLGIFEIESSEFKKLENNLCQKNIKFEIKNKEQNIFQGIIKEVICENLSDSRVVLRIEAIDSTYVLDEECKNRIYQDTNISYKTIVEDILKNRGINYHISKSFDKKIDKIFYQNETDWKFLVRISSYIGEHIFITTEGVILFGSDNIYNVESVKENVV